MDSRIVILLGGIGFYMFSEFILYWDIVRCKKQGNIYKLEIAINAFAVFSLCLTLSVILLPIILFAF